MPLLFIDGFDHYATADILKKWQSITGSPTINASGGRRGGGCLEGIASGRYVGRGYANQSEVVVGFAFKPSTLSAAGSNRYALALLDGSTIQVAFHFASDGSVIAYRGSPVTNVLGSSASGIVGTGAYNYFEFRVLHHASAGEVEVRLNGAQILSLTGLNTAPTGNAWSNGFRSGVAGSTDGSTGSFDDLYVYGGGTFLGDVRIDAIYPNGAGTHQAWTPSTGADHAALVDETAPNTTDYLTGGAAGTKETLALQDLSINGAILGVQVNNAVSKTDAGACTIKNLIRSGSSEASGPTYAPSTTYLYSSSIHETDPATGAPWLTAAINALEAGAEVVS